jgi:hypothetical protein
MVSILFFVARPESQSTPSKAGCQAAAAAHLLGGMCGFLWVIFVGMPLHWVPSWPFGASMVIVAVIGSLIDGVTSS